MTRHLLIIALACLACVSCSKAHANVSGVTPTQQGSDANPLDGKSVMFVGNSFIYYGGCVESGAQRSLDMGMFYQLCKSRGADVKVYDSTYGGHHLYDYTAAGCKNGCTGTMSATGGSSHAEGDDLWKGIPLASLDYVFISESGDNNANFVTDIEALMKRIRESGNTRARFVYLCHSYTWIKNHTRIIDNLPVIHNGGYKVAIVNWGKLVYDIINANVKVPGATQAYSKTSFIKNNGDTYHPNPLAGYITAEMCYLMAMSLETGKAASCKGLDTCYDSYVAPSCFVPGDSGNKGIDAFIAKHYKSAGDTNCKAIFESASDIAGLQELMDKYVINELQ